MPRPLGCLASKRLNRSHVQSSHHTECICRCTNCICNPFTLWNAFGDVQIAYAILSPYGMHLAMYKLHMQSSHLWNAFISVQIAYAILLPYGMHLSVYKLHMHSSHPMECICQCTNCICNPLTVCKSFVNVQMAYAILSPYANHLSMYKLQIPGDPHAPPPSPPPSQCSAVVRKANNSTVTSNIGNFPSVLKTLGPMGLYRFVYSAASRCGVSLVACFRTTSRSHIKTGWPLGNNLHMSVPHPRIHVRSFVIFSMFDGGSGSHDCAVSACCPVFTLMVWLDRHWCFDFWGTYCFGQWKARVSRNR